ncbi:hypothetical protein FPZ24_04490 [Sphingomonas panacisoli]|uniref:Uncharacterized protein n=1 Tax=Sphingomonas panacisoli TaxID=1813879 RepID=A0A5B8LGC8_9SPHN|nr:hypothetical protein FPZ24_04490 [Sphingomonas panacisoli]
MLDMFPLDIDPLAICAEADPEIARIAAAAIMLMVLVMVFLSNSRLLATDAGSFGFERSLHFFQQSAGSAEGQFD